MLRHGSTRPSVEGVRAGAAERIRRLATTIGYRLLALGGAQVEPPVEVGGAGLPVEALGHEPSSARVPVVLYRASTTDPSRTDGPWRSVAPDLRSVLVEGRHRGHDSVMGRDRVHQIVDDLMATVLRPR